MCWPFALRHGFLSFVACAPWLMSCRWYFSRSSWCGRSLRTSIGWNQASATQVSGDPSGIWSTSVRPLTPHISSLSIWHPWSTTGDFVVEIGSELAYFTRVLTGRPPPVPKSRNFGQAFSDAQATQVCTELGQIAEIGPESDLGAWPTPSPT